MKSHVAYGDDDDGDDDDGDDDGYVDVFRYFDHLRHYEDACGFYGRSCLLDVCGVCGSYHFASHLAQQPLTEASV